MKSTEQHPDNPASKQRLIANSHPPFGKDWEFSIDVGGTFTDWIARSVSTGQTLFGKVLSSSCEKGDSLVSLCSGWVRLASLSGGVDDFWKGYRLRLFGTGGVALGTWSVGASRGGELRLDRSESLPELDKVRQWELASPEPSPIFAIRRLLGLPLGATLPPVSLRLGTTRGTNALLTRQGARTALVTTRGFGDLLLIGQQDRPQLFDLNVRKPAPLFERAIEIDERVGADGTILRVPDRQRVREQLLELQAAGIRSLGVCLLHGFRFPQHERLVGEVARETGFHEISLSSDVAPLIRMVPRGETTVLDAFLNPVIREYCDQILEALGTAGELQLMTSAGTLVNRDRFTGKDSVLSGPAGGVVGFARAARQAGFSRAIGFDMGGTSTDVARYGGQFEREFESRKGGIRILTPVMAIETVAAGGGSICRFDGVRMTVGPESAGAVPGPACYGAGGPLTVSDLNLLLGRISPEQFPFQLDRNAAEQRLAELHAEVVTTTGRRLSLEELAAGLLEIADETMAMAIRSVSVQKGYDPREHLLVAFGGAGPQHATAVARRLGMRQVLVPPLCSLLSAAGIQQAEQAAHAAESVLAPLDGQFLEAWPALRGRLVSRAAIDLGIGMESVDSPVDPLASLSTGEAGPGKTRIVAGLDLRYSGTEPTIHVREPQEFVTERPEGWRPSGAGLVASRATIGEWETAFREAHRQLYGFAKEQLVEVVSARVELTIDDEQGRTDPEASEVSAGTRSHTEVVGEPLIPGPGSPAPDRSEAKGFVLAAPAGTARVWFRDVSGQARFREVPGFDWASLQAGASLTGPAIISGTTTTLALDPGWSLKVLHGGDLLLEDHQDTEESDRVTGDTAATTASDNEYADPVELEILNRQFVAIAGQMGITLQRTASSVNIRDRLDFSCAVFSGKGELVVNAPHIPVHLGSMGEAVRGVIADNPHVLPGDVFVTNHPYRGGSHLPDVTVVSPVFIGREPSVAMAETTADHALTPDFWVASRGHHAEIGGRTPGSMPPDATTLTDEGVLLDNVRVVAAGEERLETVERLLKSARWPSRNPAENLADLRAQMAANQLGVRELQTLTTRYGLVRLKRMMLEIRRAAGQLVRLKLKALPDGRFCFSDKLDSGALIRVAIEKSGSQMVIDFAGTDPVQPDNLNANRGIVCAATMYVLRSLLDQDIPLNDGLLEPVEIRIPENCFLNPVCSRDSENCPAIVGGNVETSQRIVDVLLGALGLAAASQGTMNNWLMGGAGFGYYETLGGGTGATAAGAGADAVHSHMSNTRLTDPEVLETRFPVRLSECSIRRGSGGAGLHRGGDGMRRCIQFLQPLTVSLLTSRRLSQPYGMDGGEPGASGINRLIRADGTSIELPFRTALEVLPGDQLMIETPGGGGWGKPVNDLRL